MKRLYARLDEIARTPVLLVATDFDGTIADIADDPMAVSSHPAVVGALTALSSMAQTEVAVISGRGLAVLTQVAGISGGGIRLVGSHGSEFDVDDSNDLPSDALDLRARLIEDVNRIAAEHPGCRVEEKPVGVALHYRGAPAGRSGAIRSAVLEGPATFDGVHVLEGKMVVELCVVPSDKGRALDVLRRQVGATAVVYIGDDVTDEFAFERLGDSDLGIKVGEGATAATERLANVDAVATALSRLCELRAEAITEAYAVPIERHSMLSDLRTAALVTPNATISWMCVPRIDSAAIFADLLGGPSAGFFAIRNDDGESPHRQAYHHDSLVLETEWQNARLIDFLECSDERVSTPAGRTNLVRILRGTGRFTIEFAPRLDFGRMHTSLRVRDDGIETTDTVDSIALLSPGVRWEIVEEGHHLVGRAKVDLSDGECLFDLRFGAGDSEPVSEGTDARLAATDRYWSEWCRRLRLPDVQTDFVRRSALLLKGLCYGPTGAICAAATTSLPERIGGVRNWDYRFCWLRDAAMMAKALLALGSEREGFEFLEWMRRVAADCDAPDRLRPLYSVSGEPLGAEGEIGELSGYRGSRPVRVGNGASQQIQVDVYGPIADLVHDLALHDAERARPYWPLVEFLVEGVRRRWKEPDHGIWEIRRGRRHHVHSKVMSWFAVDRGLATAAILGVRAPADWGRLRERIARDVISRGFKRARNAFTAAYDGDDVDAATLHVGLSGLLPADDDRFVGTVAAIERELLQEPTVYRYHSDDGLPGHEGGFHVCTSWLIDAYIAMNRLDDARALFSRLIALAGPTGVLSEQYGAHSRRSLGNVPQGYSHLGVIHNALNLARASLPSPAERSTV